MARRLLEEVDQYTDTHPHHLECPRCGRHSVVLYNESIYVCLNCNWERDVSRHRSFGDGPPPFLVILALIIVIVIL